MGTSLMLRDRGGRFGTKRYVLQVRTHDLSGTEYDTIAFLAPPMVGAVLAARVAFLFGTPDDLDRSCLVASPGRLVASWDRSLTPPREYALDVVFEDGTRVRVAELTDEAVLDAVRTEDAAWDGEDPFGTREHEDECRRRRVASLRAEADRLEAGPAGP